MKLVCAIWFSCLPQAKRELQAKLDEVNSHLEQQVMNDNIYPRDKLNNCYIMTRLRFKPH